MHNYTNTQIQLLSKLQICLACVTFLASPDDAAAAADDDNDDDDDDDDSLGRVELVVVGGKHMKGDTPPTPPLRAHYPAVHTSIVV